MSFLPLVRIWIVISALASVSGWVLSSVQQLNLAGYAVTTLLGAMLLFLMRHSLAQDGRCFCWKRITRRFTRPIPLAFAGLALLVFLGGALYHPSNYDGLTYRVPRVLHWLDQQQWHWIHTVNYRMNDRSCGFEWLMAPILVATQSDRFLFLINFLPFLLLPSLVFSTFTRLGVSARISWYWMWLLPAGYNYLLQAGSIGNDGYSAVYALAAVDFALRAKAGRRIGDVWLSLVAMALLTGAKFGNLPLLLPWFLLFIPLAPKLLSKPLASLLVILTALLASFLPTALLNYINCSDWTGLALENPNIAIQNPLVGIPANSAVLLASNFAPTVFPLAGWWNHSALSFLPGKISALLLANFEGPFYQLGEIPTEEWAGVGFGLSTLLLVTVLAAWAGRRRFPFHCDQPPMKPAWGWHRRIVLWSPYVALLFFFSKSGMMTLARLVSAYYPLLLPALLCGSAKAALVRRRWWRWSALAVMLLAFPVVILTPARPLWPARTVLSRMGNAELNDPFGKRIKDVYFTYADRPDPLAEVRATLPDDCTIVGFAAGCNDTEISFWRPFGRRRVEDILPGDSWSQIHARQIQYAVVGESFLAAQDETLQTWLLQHRATLVATITATLFVSDRPHFWQVVRFDWSSSAPDASPKEAS